MSAIALQASGIKKSYAKDGRPLEILDVERFAAREGEFITIIGPSGCGKSTFLHIMGGFIAAEAGRIEVYGKRGERPRPRPRHDVPGVLALPVEDRRRQHRLGPGSPGHARRPDRGDRAEAARHDRPRGIPQPLPGRALRRHEAARRARARARLRSRRCCSWTSPSARSTRRRAS